MAASLKAPPRPISSKRFGKELDLNDQPKQKKFCHSTIIQKDLDLYPRTNGGTATTNNTANNGTTSGVTANGNGNNNANGNKTRNRSLSPTDTSAVDNQTRKQELEDNVDYIALCSVLSILKTQRSSIIDDIRKLNRIRRKAVEQPHEFVADLKSKRIDLPGQVKLTSLPPIQWSKYGLSNSELVQKELKASRFNVKPVTNKTTANPNDNDEKFTKSLRLFDK